MHQIWTEHDLRFMIQLHTASCEYNFTLNTIFTHQHVIMNIHKGRIIEVLQNSIMRNYAYFWLYSKYMNQLLLFQFLTYLDLSTFSKSTRKIIRYLIFYLYICNFIQSKLHVITRNGILQKLVCVNCGQWI